MRLAFAVFCVTKALFGQAAQPKLGKIEGKVVHSVTGVAVPRVSLTLMPNGSSLGVISSGPPQPAGVVSSGADGSFSFAGVPAGSYRLTGERNGFMSGSYGSGSQVGLPTTLRVTEGQEISGITFKLAPQSVVAVKVLDENSDPVNRSMIQVLRSRFVGGQRQLMPMSGGQTNDLGEYRASIGAGTYYITAAAGPIGVMAIPPRQPGQTADEVIVTTYYPGAIDRANARPITVGVGQEVPVIIHLQKGRTFRVRGSVSADLGRSPLMLMPKNREAFSFTRGGAVQPDGSFEFSGVAPGSYYLAASRSDVNTMSNPSLRATVEVTDRDVESVAFQAVESVTLKGRVIIEGNKDNEKPDFVNMRVFPTPLDGLPGGPNGPPEVAVDGTFTISGLSQGRYQLRVFGSQPGYLKSVRFGQLDVTNSGIDLTEVTAPPPIELVYSRKTATVTVTVIRDSPERSVGMVLLVPDSPQVAALAGDMGYMPLGVNQAGLANGQALPPGKYRVYALEAYDIMEGIDPAVLKRLESKAERINVGEEETVTVSVKQLLPADLETH